MVKDIYLQYRERILLHIRGVLIWLLSSPFTLGVQSVPYSIGTTSSRREDCPRHVQSGVIPLCYATMCIAYVLKYCKAAAQPVLGDPRLRERLELLSGVCKLPDSRENKEQDLEFSLLHWHQYGSLFQICEQLQSDSTPGGADRWYLTDLQQRREAWQKTVQRILNPSRKPRSHSYTAKHEVEDRLALLSRDMHQRSYAFAATKACVGYVTRRLRRREATKIINPGLVYSRGEASDSDTPHEAPWELTCLNHHTSLLILPTADEPGRESEILERIEACAEFSMSDYTFASSWDESDGNMIGSVSCLIFPPYFIHIYSSSI